MLSFQQFLVEASGQHGVLAFGRFQPPTRGHEEVVKKVLALAAKHKALHTIVLSHTQDKKKNPLDVNAKVKHAKRAFAGANIVAASSDKPTILHHAVDMHDTGVEHLHVVVGSDRVEDTTTLLNKYNGKQSGHGMYNFKSITVHPAGRTRSAKSGGVKGVSGTKMRDFATQGDKESFLANVPSSMSPEHAEEMYNDTRRAIGSNE